MANVPTPNRGRIIRKSVGEKKAAPMNQPPKAPPAPESSSPSGEPIVKTATPSAPASSPPSTPKPAAPDKSPVATGNDVFLKPIALKLNTFFPKTQVRSLLSGVGADSHHALVRLVRYLWPMRDGVMIPDKVLHTAPDRLSGFLFALEELKVKNHQQYELLLAFLKKQRTVPQPFSPPYLFRGFGLQARQAQKEMTIKQHLQELGLY